jgi:ribonucleotide monophosphatase NagD (HAD superfamily)
MAKTPTNNGKPWTTEDLKTLKELARKNTPTGLIANQLGRSESAVSQKATELGISLKPANKSPYN